MKKLFKKIRALIADSRPNPWADADSVSALPKSHVPTDELIQNIQSLEKRIALHEKQIEEADKEGDKVLYKSLQDNEKKLLKKFYEELSKRI